MSRQSGPSPLRASPSERQPRRQSPSLGPLAAPRHFDPAAPGGAVAVAQASALSRGWRHTTGPCPVRSGIYGITWFAMGVNALLRNLQNRILFSTGIGEQPESRGDGPQFPSPAPPSGLRFGPRPTEAFGLSISFFRPRQLR